MAAQRAARAASSRRLPISDPEKAAANLECLVYQMREILMTVALDRSLEKRLKRAQLAFAEMDRMLGRR